MINILGFIIVYGKLYSTISIPKSEGIASVNCMACKLYVTCRVNGLVITPCTRSIVREINYSEPCEIYSINSSLYHIIKYD